MAQTTTGSSVPQLVLTPTLNIANVAHDATTTSDQDFTITGLTPGMLVHIAPVASLTAGLAIVGATVTAKNTLTLRLYNPTGADINPPSQAFNLIAF